jgi:excisionase family DNA binding protein
MEKEIKYINSEEAAKILGVNVSTIKRWTDAGKLSCIKTVGGHRKFLLPHLTEFVKIYKKSKTRIDLFPLDSKQNLELSYHITKNDLDYLISYVKESALSTNRPNIQMALMGMYLSDYPLHSIYDKVLTPVLHQIGQMWEKNEITVINEHFASQAIRDCIVRLQGVVQIPVKKKTTALCVNLSSELHDIALKMVDHILEIRGFRTFFSGQITPITEMENIFRQLHPDRIYVSSTVVENRDSFQIELLNLLDLCSQYNCRAYLGGTGFNEFQIDHSAVEKYVHSFEEVYND